MHYLGQLDDSQVFFRVKQKRPKTLDEAVSATLELELYLLKSPQTGGQAVSSFSNNDELIVASIKKKQDTMMKMLLNLMERLDKLECTQATPPDR